MKSHFPGHDDVDSLEQKLFASLDRDEPPVRARHAAAAALGLGTTVLTTATAGAEGATVVAKAAPWLLAKWIGLGALAGGLSMGTIRYAAKLPADAPKPAATMTSAPPVIKAPNALSQMVTPEPRAAEPPVAPAEPPSAAAREVTIVQRPSDARAKAIPQRAPSAAESAIDNRADSTVAPSQPINSRQLAAEVATLDEARSAIAAKDGARALEVLRRYAREFPAATLTHEATVLRIEALYATGSSDAATALGRDFLTAHPKSTHASLVRRLLAEHQKP